MTYISISVIIHCKKRGCMKNLTNKAKNYTQNALDFEVQLIEKMPECDCKTSFLMTSKMLLNQVEKDGKVIHEQLFLLPKFYESAINKDKILFDANVHHFAKLIDFDILKSCNMMKAMMNSQVCMLIDKIDYYAKHEMIVRKNINTHLQNCAKCYSFLNKGIRNFNINNKNLENLMQSLPKDDDFNKQNLPNFYYCKKDLINKIKYVNSFTPNFIEIDNSMLADFDKNTTNNKIKGDYSL